MASPDITSEWGWIPPPPNLFLKRSVTIIPENPDPQVTCYVSGVVDKWMHPNDDLDAFEDRIEKYKKHVARKWAFICICAVAAMLTFFYSLTVGDFAIPFDQTYVTVWNHITGNITNETYDYVVMKRMARILAGLITGAGLAVAGAVMQSILRNPLADPYTTGVSSGAMFGATMAMTMGITLVSGSYSLVANAFVFSLVPMAVILLIARVRSASPTVMIMAGLSVMFIFNAFTTLMKLWSDPNDLASLYQWQVGTLGMAGWSNIPIMLGIVAAGTVVLQFLSRKMNVLSTGDENAKAMGVNISSLRSICLLIISLMCASIVSFTGLIGFVGIVAPHIVRMFVGADNRYMIPASAVFGAALVVLADLGGRTLFAPVVLQVGVVMAFLGGPVFLWLILRKKSNVW